MSQIIDRLKEGLAEAQKRNLDVTKRFQQTQAEWQASNAEVNGYIKVIELETRRELQRAAATPTVAEPAADAQQEEGTINKTQIVRDALAAHPGLTPAQLWGAVRKQIDKRTYVYSVLKRLKDRKQIIEKRGKYYLPPTPKPEVTEQQVLQ